MDVRQHLVEARTEPPRRSSERLLLLVPLVLIVVITVTDLGTAPSIHLGPALVIAPAITPSFAGTLRTAFIGLLAVIAQILIGVWHGGIGTSNHIVQIITIAVLSLLIVFFSSVRERHSRQLAQVRSVAEAAQHVLLWPLPERIGPLKVASLYLAAEDEAQVGGDLYAATRTAQGTRLLIGDVRGKGLAALGEAAMVLGSFREAAHQQEKLLELAVALDRSVERYTSDFDKPEEKGERFATSLLVEIPDGDRVVRMTSCGHPPPLLLGSCPGEAVTVPTMHPSPPLGLGVGELAVTLDKVPFEAGETLLLYTDGVIEARNAEGTFYPFTDRAAQWAGLAPEVLLHHLRRDLLRYVGGRLDDDAAIVAIARTGSGPQRSVADVSRGEGQKRQ